MDKKIVKSERQRIIALEKQLKDIDKLKDQIKDLEKRVCDLERGHYDK